MFKHKHRADEIPDFKGFLVYLKNTNPDLYGRYQKEIKTALVADIIVFISFIIAIVAVILALFNMVNLGYLSDELIIELVLFIFFLIIMIISSVLGRKAHSRAIQIESEIVVEYHRSGFNE